MKHQNYIQHISNGTWLSEMLMITFPLSTQFQLSKRYTVKGKEVCAWLPLYYLRIMNLHNLVEECLGFCSIP